MDFTDDSRRDSVAAALAEVGDRWTFLVLRECFFGVRRFTDMQRNLGVARNILADRLAKLVEHHILERQRYSERPPREEYHLTEKGRGLYQVTTALMFWADRWIVADPPLSLRHRDDDAEIEQILRCTCCGKQLSIYDIEYHDSRTERSGVQATEIDQTQNRDPR